jgi:GT2 family glycosyltransferase
MRPNGTPAKKPADEPSGTLRRVTSISRWLARKKAPGAMPAPRVSVVLPVFNGEATLGECLERLYQSDIGEFETILVDDGSTDRTRDIAARFPVRVVPSGGRVGPAAARNIGAREARGDVLFFIDADVMVRPDTLGTLLAGMEREEVDGFNGIQSARMRHRNLASQYKNMWIRWTYLRQHGDVPLFYTTAAAIRRDAFLESGGFDVGYGGPSVEDTAFGQKLKRLGVKVHPELEVEHVKRYSLKTLLVTDYKRSVSLTRLKLRHPRDLGENNTSVPASYMASVPLFGLALGLGVLGAALGIGWVQALFGLALAATVVLNLEFLNAIRISDGIGRAIASIPLLWLELLVVGTGTAVGLLSYPFGRRY